MKLETWDEHVEVLINSERLRLRIAELGEQITADYRGGALCVVGVLKGSFVFFADLVRRIELPTHCEFIGISSYGDEAASSGVVQITSDLSRPIEGMDVLIVEDIVDTGLSMQYLMSNLATRKPRSVKVCTLLEKPDNAKVTVPLDYVGFRIPNEFVVGFGLDYAGLYRNLPYIGTYHGQT